MGLLSQPLELLEEILFNIDEPKDLLAAALANSSLHKRIIPDHIDYRWISCNLYRAKLWRFLAQKPRYASRIRRLSLISETSSAATGMMGHSGLPVRLPRIFMEEDASNCTREISFEDLVHAVKGMTSLTHLDQICVEELSLQWQKEFALALTNSSLLSLQSGLTLDAVYEPSKFLWNMPLPSLQVLRLRIITITHATNPTQLFLNIVHSINLSPLLRELSLVVCLRTAWQPGLVAPGYLPILHHGNWPELKRLTLQSEWSLYPRSATNDEKATTMSAFLQRHKALEILDVGTPHVFVPGCIPEDTLPHLHSISVSCSQIPTEEVCLSKIIPIEIAQRLRHMEIYVSAHCIDTFQKMAKLVSCNVVIDTRTVPAFYAALSGKCIQRLCLQVKRLQHAPSLETTAFAADVSFLKNLTHFGGFLNCLEPHTRVNLSAALKQATNLRWISVRVPEDGWMEVIRNSEGEVQGLQPSRRSGKNTRQFLPKYWSGSVDIDCYSTLISLEHE